MIRAIVLIVEAIYKNQDIWKYINNKKYLVIFDSFKILHIYDFLFWL